MKFKADKELKQVIKHLVKEALVEVLAESKLEALVEQKLNSKRFIPETFEPSYDRLPESSVAEVMSTSRRDTIDQRKNKMMNELKVPDEAWESIYADTAKSQNSVLGTDRNHTSPGNPSPELVPENVMEAMGLMDMDFSKHLGHKASKSQMNTEEHSAYNKAFAERAAMLKKLKG